MIYHLVKPPVLKSEVVAEKLFEHEPETVSDAGDWGARREDSLWLTVTVFDGKTSEVRWWDEGGEHVVWSNIDFKFFTGVPFVETPDVNYSLMIFLTEVSEKETREWNALADQRGLPASERMAMPRYPLVPSLVKGRSRFLVGSSPRSQSNGRDLAAMVDLHRYYDANKQDLKRKFEEAETARIAQEAWQKAHPPVPEDVIVEYFPIRSSMKLPEAGE